MEPSTAFAADDRLAIADGMIPGQTNAPSPSPNTPDFYLAESGVAPHDRLSAEPP